MWYILRGVWSCGTSLEGCGHVVHPRGVWSCGTSLEGCGHVVHPRGVWTCGTSLEGCGHGVHPRGGLVTWRGGWNILEGTSP